MSDALNIEDVYLFTFFIIDLISAEIECLIQQNEKVLLGQCRKVNTLSYIIVQKHK